MAAPNPERVIELLEEIRRLCDETEEAYRWLHSATLSQTQRSGERVGGGSGPGSGGPTAAVGTSGQGERVLAGRRVTTLHSSTSDYCRRKLEHTGELVTKATGSLRGAAGELSRAFHAIDEDAKRHDDGLPPVPRDEEPWEIDRARHAQGRRTARGEVYAEDAVPRPDVEYPSHRFVGRGVLCRECGETAPHPNHNVAQVG